MTIDIHAHTVPEAFIKAVAAEVPAACPTIESGDGGWYFSYPGGRRSGPFPAGMFDIDARLADMDRDGVDVHALSVPPPQFQYRLEAGAAAAHARLYNDALVDIARAHPDRFVVLGTLPMQDVASAVAELERLISIPEIVGLELATNVAGTNLGDDSFSDLWAAVAAAGLAVVLHPSEVAGHDRMHDYYLHNFVGNPTDSTLAAGSLIFSGVLERNAALRIALLHGGGFLPYQIGRFDHGWQVRPEAAARIGRPPSHYLDRFWFDTLTHDRGSLQFLLARVGADRLALGSDYPFDMADPDPVGSVRAAVADPAALDKILRQTPEALLTRVTEVSHA
ncbi:aminocarboxymuconate-semialdehyde decarboxylase [Mycolicibacterium agri]|uniref:Amidohydrolase n=1 Tax=Mycolicibacterium agri TaxID=36811 RepID=A0A2A7MVX5_MYCAG|nr:amidohydrolase family protein [Mycolicibacterium agri]PEG35710.1 aminocarboxymuconate-semialdehyde decarboxylase [Mycolicibacterium agri]GFG54143.1 amidohydrolase [Mycolicibacterium agri]